VIFTPMSELRDFIVRRLPKQCRQIEEGPGSVRFAVAANELAGYPAFRGSFRAHDLLVFTATGRA
jgi:hypothetical protein